MASSVVAHPAHPVRGCTSLVSRSTSLRPGSGPAAGPEVTLVAASTSLRPSRRSGVVAQSMPSDDAEPAPLTHGAPKPLEYEVALELARIKNFSEARRAFEHCVATYPHLCKAWVSYAQMEKKTSPARCRATLRRGLQVNPSSGCLLQAWGLHEMQRQNLELAIGLLEFSVLEDPELLPVLKWQRHRKIGAKSRSQGRSYAAHASSLSCGVRGEACADVRRSGFFGPSRREVS